MEILIIIGTFLGLALFGRVAYSLGYGKGYSVGVDHAHDKFIDKIKRGVQSRDGEPRVFRG